VILTIIWCLQKLKERLLASKRAARKFDVDVFNLKT